MCEAVTARKILEVVKTLPEDRAKEVLDFAEALSKGESLLDLVDTLPELTSFKGDSVEIQRRLRDEWR